MTNDFITALMHYLEDGKYAWGFADSDGEEWEIVIRKKEAK